MTTFNRGLESGGGGEGAKFYLGVGWLGEGGRGGLSFFHGVGWL